MSKIPFLTWPFQSGAKARGTTFGSLEKLLVKCWQTSWLDVFCIRQNINLYCHTWKIVHFKQQHHTQKHTQILVFFQGQIYIYHDMTAAYSLYGHQSLLALSSVNNQNKQINWRLWVFVTDHWDKLGMWAWAEQRPCRWFYCCNSQELGCSSLGTAEVVCLEM